MRSGQSREVDKPRPGFFRGRLAPNGHRVPARIEITEDGLWLATVNGQQKLPATEEPNSDVLRIWHFFHEEIDRDEYDYLLELKAHCEKHSPWHPSANPSAPIEIGTLPPPF